jgi:hypothetical protein
MMPSSEDLEEFHDRIKRLDSALARLKGAEVSRAETVTELATVAKEWLRMAPQLKSGADGYLSSLEQYDSAMSEVLASTKQRSRATAYRTRLKPFTEGFLDSVVVPLMRFEGAPGQVASRQISAQLAGPLLPEEVPYIDEAARCSSVHCHRAAIVLLWAAGIARLHTRIQSLGFSAFNAAAAAAAAKKGPPYNRLTKNLSIQSLAELQRSRDFDVLAVGLELWSLDLQTFEELERLLGIRNSAAHPGMFQPGALDVLQFATKLRTHLFETIK